MRFAGYCIAVLALAGAVVSALAVQVHYSTKTEPCYVNQRWDCGIVNHSTFAEIGGVPVAAIGVAGYLALGILALSRQRFLTFLAALLGLGFALRLTFVEEYVIHLWCIYCVISQSIIGVIVLLALISFGAEYYGLKRGRGSA
jgi:vitamin-K-epoxide reductase (warfarin-sensitive)